MRGSILQVGCKFKHLALINQDFNIFLTENKENRPFGRFRIVTVRHLYISRPRIAESLMILLSSAGSAICLQLIAIAVGYYRSPRKFATSHGSARCRETRQRRSSALANAVCVTARASRLARIYCWFSSPQLSQWDEENPRLTALDANRLFDVVILQKCQYCSRRHAATFRPKNHIIVHTQSKYAFRHVGMLHGASGQFSCQQSL